MKQYNLRIMLEWYIEIEQNWSLKPGSHGRQSKRHLPEDIWKDLANTCVGASEEENWQALFAIIALFRRVAVDVGEALEFSYPDDMHDRTVRYLNRVKDLDRSAESFS